MTTTPPAGAPKVRRGDRAMRWMRRHQWLLLGALVVVGAVLGLIGWRKQEPTWGWVDVVYADFGMVTFWSGPSTTNNWYLGVARFLLPLALGFTALFGLFAAFQDRLMAMRAGFLKGHVIVVGLGDKGYGFAESARAQGASVLVIDLEPRGTNLEACRRLGIHTMTGDARDPDVLVAAGVDRARDLVAVGPSDDVNAAVAVRAMELSAGRQGSVLRCLVHIEDGDLANLLRLRQFRRSDAPGARIDFFSLSVSGAQLLLDRYPPHLDGGEGGSIWLVGVDDLWDGFLAKLALAGEDRGVADGSVSVTLVGKGADAELAEVAWQLGDLRDQLRIDAADVDAHEVRVDAVGGADAVRDVYVRLDTDEATLATALSLDAQLPAGVQVVACLTRTAALTGLLGEVERAGERLQVVALVAALCNRGQIEDSAMETLARAFHGHYVSRRLAEGQDPSSNPSTVPWEELEESLRESNRDLARHIGVKLRFVGCELVPARFGDTGGFEFTVAEVDGLAPAEHDRWTADMARNGWRYAPGKKDPVAKTSPYMVPWNKVPPEIQEYDREAIRDIPEVLARVGLRIVRVG